MRLKKPSKKVVFIGLPILVVIVILVFSMSGSKGNKTMVQADLVSLGDITEMVTASGRIQPQTKVDIVSEVSSQIIDVLVKEGDRVGKNQPLLLLDTIQLKSDVAQARFTMDEIMALADGALTDYEKNKLEYDRQTRLYKQKLTSENAYTDARFAYESATANQKAMDAQVKNAQARLDKAQDNLRKTRIIAPMEGVVTSLNAEVGEVAQAQTSYTQGKTLMTVADLAVFEVEVEVDETEIGKVRLGQPAKIRVDAYRDTVFEGTVVEIGNSAIIEGVGADNYTTAFRVKVRFADTGDFSVRPGMSASVDITTARSEGVLKIPYAAIVTREFDADSLSRDNVDAALSRDTDESGSVQATEVSSSDEPEVIAAVAVETDKPHSPKKREKIKKSGVFIIKDGKAKFVEVSTGVADELNVAALNGVAEQDTVISGSFRTLRSLKVGDEVAVDEQSLKKMRESEI